MTLRHFATLACAAALLSACNSAEEPAETEEAPAAPAPVLTTAAVPTAAPDGTALVPGAWSVGENAEGASASFGEAGAAPAMTIACNSASRAVTLTRAGAGSAPAAYVLEAGGTAARLDMVPTGDGAGMTAAIEPAMPVFAGFSAESGVIAITSPDGEKLQYPAYPGIRRVMEACS